VIAEEGASGVAAAEVLDAVDKALGRAHDRRSLLLYVHIPFCSSKCSFCGWVAGIPTPQLRSPDETRSQYVSSVVRQIKYYAPRLTAIGYVPEIVYWGGGTPSILSAEQITAIGDALQENFDLSGVYEYSVESSPETLTAEKVKALQSAGVNRLSIGVQSFDDGELRRAGRAHSSRVAEEAIGLVRQQGCVNLNIDIITGFPGQTPDILERTIARTGRLRPEHVTAYSYYVVNQTVMARQLERGYSAGRNTEERALAQDRAYETLTGAGYTEYMPMYYSASPQQRFAGEGYYFDWLGDHIGFGSGANSIVGHHLLVSKRGNLDGFISSPTTCDHVERMGMRSALDDSIKQLTTFGRPLNYGRFHSRFGFDFEPLLAEPRLKGLRRVLESLDAPLILDSDAAHISAPGKGWHGGDLVRLNGNIAAMVAAAKRRHRQPASASR
jgi:coproporphyrinogen III oxidase-like Fe-S oxidoreductase